MLQLSQLNNSASSSVLKFGGQLFDGCLCFRSFLLCREVGWEMVLRLAVLMLSHSMPDLALADSFFLCSSGDQAIMRSRSNISYILPAM
jgi:hypothetical protein